MQFRKIMYLYFLLPVLLPCQELDVSLNNTLIKVKSGVLFTVDNRYLFSNREETRIPSDIRSIYIKPGYSIGIGADFLSLFKIEDIFINIGIDIVYGHATTGTVSMLTENIAKMNYDQFTSLLWLKLKNSGTLNPYFGIGIGIKQKWIDETHSRYTEDNSDFSQLLFCMGLSTGISYQISNEYVLTFFLDSFYTRGGKKVFLENDIFYDFNKESGSIITGIEFGYTL